MVMARTQTLVQLSDELLAALDQEIARTGRSRSELIRDAVRRYLEERIEAEIDRQIVEGYTRQPQEADDLEALAQEGARRLIAEEPW